MQKRTKLLLAGGAAAMLTLGGLAGLAQADMDEGMAGGRCGMGMGMGVGEGRGHGMMGRHMMERYDADKDGKVTQAEIDRNRQQWLSEADADKNGTLSLDEFKVLWLKARNEMMVREFQFFDRDGNGQVTIEEYQGPMAGIVADRDRNDDGSLGADDRTAAGGNAGERPRWRHLHGRMGHGMGNGLGQGMGDGGGEGMGRGQGMMGGGNGPCMGEGGGPADTGDDADQTPGETPATP